ncbi:MAG: hypothetical protein CL927_01785 [Deltaproteobacteria bacterium]|nr:hypothetical protein [Deltaproteobacteria bacterium]
MELFDAVDAVDRLGDHTSHLFKVHPSHNPVDTVVVDAEHAEVLRDGPLERIRCACGRHCGKVQLNLEACSHIDRRVDFDRAVEQRYEL